MVLDLLECNGVILASLPCLNSHQLNSKFNLKFENKQNQVDFLILKLKSDSKEFPYVFGTDQSDRDVIAVNHKEYVDAVNVHKDNERERKFT